MSENFLKTLLAVLGTCINVAFGGWDTSLSVLAIFLLLDLITGIAKAYIKGDLSSSKGRKGTVRKFLTLSIVIVGHLLDRLMCSNAPVFRTLVIYYFVANEGVSILENAASCGIPVPTKLMEGLNKLKGE